MSVVAFDPMRDRSYEQTRLGRDILDFLAWKELSGMRPRTLLAVGARCRRHPPQGTETGADVATVSALGTGNGGRAGWRVGAEEAAGGNSSLSGIGNGGPDDNDAQAGRLVAFHPTGGGAKGMTPSIDETPGLGTGRNGTVAVAYALNGKRDDGESETFVAAETSVRRLTPVECERLQGLPDGWTALGPDSKRYAALGDAVTVPVAEWIGRQLLHHNIRATGREAAQARIASH